MMSVFAGRLLKIQKHKVNSCRDLGHWVMRWWVSGAKVRHWVAGSLGAALNAKWQMLL